MNTKLFKEILDNNKDAYDILVGSIHHNIFDKFRRYQGDKPVQGLYEKEITISYKNISDICFEGAKDFLNNYK